MSMLGLFRRSRPAHSADTAKDRLQVLLSHERTGRAGPDYLPLLQRDILKAIERHMQIDGESVDIRLERADDLSTLEINIELPNVGAQPVRSAS